MREWVFRLLYHLLLPVLEEEFSERIEFWLDSSGCIRCSRRKD